MGLRPLEFWKLTPSETYQFIEAQVENRNRAEEEAWRRIRWAVMWMVNMSGKSLKRELKEQELLRLRGESRQFDRINWARVRKRALWAGRKHMRKFPHLLKKGKNGQPKIYGEN